MSLGEQARLESFSGKSVAQVVQSAPLAERDDLLASLTLLYARGLLSLDGEAYIRNDIFTSGPYYHHTYLVELLLTERCNLACTYCFAEVAPQKSLMSPNTAEQILQRVLELPTHRLIIEFSGGEVFMNRPVLKFCVEYLEKHASNKEITFTAQTNAARLDGELIAYCHEHSIHLSLTLDGPADIHDAQRPLASGRGSHSRVLKAIDALQTAEVPFGVIGVVTANSIRRASDILDHYESLGISQVKLNHCTPQGFSRDAWDDIGVTGENYLDFMKSVYRWSYTHEASVRETNLEIFFLNIISRTSQYRCTRTACRAGSEFLVFDPDGYIYPCPRFKHNPSTLLGNIAVDGDRLDTLYQENILVSGIDHRNVEKIPECSFCQWRHVCRGGCSLETFEAYHTLDRESSVCGFYKGIYAFLFEELIRDPVFAATHFLSGVTLIETSELSQPAIAETMT